LRIWYDYFSRQFGGDHLYVIDNGLVWKHGMPPEVATILSATSVVKPPFAGGVGGLHKRGFDYTRFPFITGLRSYRNIVPYNDVDELFGADPERWSNLSDYLGNAERQGGVVSDVWMALPHTATKPFFLDPDLYLVHLKYLDMEEAVARQDDIREYYNKRMGGRRSLWSCSQQRLRNEFRNLIGLGWI